MRDALNGGSVVAVDEANFFSAALPEACDELADDGRRVVVSRTDQTFRGEPFVPLPALIATAEHVDKLRAICTLCGEPATRNQRLIEGDPAPTTTTPRSWSGPRSHTRRAVGTVTSSGGTDPRAHQRSPLPTRAVWRVLAHAV